MRMMPVLAGAVSLGLAIAIIGGMGLSLSPGSGAGGNETALAQNVTDFDEDEPSLEPEEGTDGSGFFSFAVGALSTIQDMVGMLVFLPGVLADLGLPSEAARALGHGIQFVIAVGLVQVALQYDIR